MKMAKTLLFVFLLPTFVSLTPLESRCRLSTFQLKDNFDMGKFQGRWFIWKVFADFPMRANLYRNREHIYTTSGANGNLDVLSIGRGPNGVCNYEHGRLSPNSSGPKFRYQPSVQSSGSLNYWVVETDYETYAVIYGCQRLMSSGRCGQAYSLILTRSKRMPTDEGEINQAIIRVCLQPVRFSPVSHTGEGCRQCDQSTWTVQPDFQLDRFLGAWYEMVFKSRTPFAEELAFNNYLEIYSLLPNGTVANTIIGRDPSNNDECFVSDRATLEQTTVPGKLLFFDSPDRSKFIGLISTGAASPKQIVEDQCTQKAPSPSHIILTPGQPVAALTPIAGRQATYARIGRLSGDDYWVIETDYTGYAFVLGCVRNPTTPPGGCDDFRSWVWSRKPCLSGDQFFKVKGLFDQFCIPEDEFFKSSQDNPCPRDSTVNPAAEQTFFVKLHVWDRIGGAVPVTGTGQLEVCVKYDKSQVKITEW